jgi:glutathione S-transferase
VHVPRIQPKPDVVALTGGYRRTPFLQVGADIYCDTALIADVLEHVQPEPPLYPLPLKGVSRIFAQWADTTLFWAAMAYNIQPKAAAMFPNEAVAQAFMADRKAMRTNMTSLRPGRRHVGLPLLPAPHRAHGRRARLPVRRRALHRRLRGLPPALVHAAPRAGAGRHPAAHAVAARVDGPHGRARPRRADPFTADDAITVAGRADAAGQNLLVDSAFQDDHGIPLGTRVTITAESFGSEATEGDLVAATRTHYSLSRTDARAGLLHVHFPRIGYVLKKADPA